MTDATISDEDRKAVADAARPIVEEAQSSFDLRARLSSPKLYKREKARLFLDAEVAAKFEDMGDQISRLDVIATALHDGLATEPVFPDDVPEEERAVVLSERADAAKQAAELQERLESLQAEAEALREAVDAESLSVHMRAVPQAAIDRAIRRARKVHRDAETGEVPAEKQEDFARMQNDEILGRAIEKIVDSTGATATFDPTTVGDLLRETLPAGQWNRLQAVFTTLMFRDQTARAAIGDPGF